MHMFKLNHQSILILLNIFRKQQQQKKKKIKINKSKPQQRATERETRETNTKK